MVTIQDADKVLRSVYLDAFTEQLNKKVSPFIAAIQKDSQFVKGKDIKWLVKNGVNGGFGGGSETGDLPKPGQNKYVECKAPLVNLYGTIELSDKVIRASRGGGEGAVIDVLNDEMNGLLDAAKENFARQILANGYTYIASGLKAKLTSTTAKFMSIEQGERCKVGMTIDIKMGDNWARGRRITKIDTDSLGITFEPEIPSTEIAAIPSTVAMFQVYVQQEQEGVMFSIMQAFHSGAVSSFYGNPPMDVMSIMGKKYSINSKLTLRKMQEAVDYVEKASGESPNMIVCDYATRMVYIELLKASRSNVDYMHLDGGFTAISYNGIPVVAEKYCPAGCMYFLNTKDFRLAQLCDWQWIEGENGSILRQKDNKAAYTATLVKYANFICTKPYAQYMMMGITV